MTECLAFNRGKQPTLKERTRGTDTLISPSCPLLSHSGSRELRAPNQKLGTEEHIRLVHTGLKGVFLITSLQLVFDLEMKIFLSLKAELIFSQAEDSMQMVESGPGSQENNTQHTLYQWIWLPWWIPSKSLMKVIQRKW